jgi:GAF domain-containing protein
VVGQIVPGTADVGVGIATAPAGDVDLEELTRPLLAALAKIAGLDTTYLTVFDWDRREQEVRFVHCAGGVEIEERSRLPLPPEVVQESLPGVTRSPPRMPSSHPDSQAARRLGLQTYVSVPVVLAKHELFGMVCGASRQTGAVSEPVVSVMEFVADIVADHITRERVAATEQRAARAEEPEPVKEFETIRQPFFCASLSIVGLLIHATVGSFGGDGRRWRNRAGLAA